MERETTKSTTNLATLPNMEREADMNKSNMSERKSPLPLLLSLSKRSPKNLNNNNKSLLLLKLNKPSLQFPKSIPRSMNPNLLPLILVPLKLSIRKKRKSLLLIPPSKLPLKLTRNNTKLLPRSKKSMKHLLSKLNLFKAIL